ncbi:MAG: HAD family hydrolase [Clostridia bacterium]|nr:HAD family hydrolase [Clostridia bacterium]
MALKAVLFDLDGTLLPMDQEVFVQGYFKLLAEKAASRGYEPEKLYRGIWAAIKAVVHNDGAKRNEEVFWRAFAGIFGPQVMADKPMFDAFYLNEFQQAKACCGFTADAAKTIQLVKAMGLRAILATNPLFPAAATLSRIRWAGMEPEDFEWVTTYENSSYCKPNPQYYQEILERTGLKPEECLMVGNDAVEDTAALAIGIPVFLLTDCLINKDNADLAAYPHGSFQALWDYIEKVK